MLMITMIKMHLLSLIILIFSVQSCKDQEFTPTQITGSKITENNIKTVTKNQKPKYFQKCIIDSYRLSDSCLFSEVKFLGQLLQELSPELINKHVQSEKSWMKENFKEMLEEIFNDDLRLMFKSISGIYIDREIQTPAFDLTTGAIYIPAKNVAFNKDQYKYATALQKPKNSLFNFEYAYHADRLNEIDKKIKYKTTKKYELAQHLYHELTHAINAFPLKSLQLKYKKDLTIFELARINISNKSYYPLYNTNLKRFIKDFINKDLDPLNAFKRFKETAEEFNFAETNSLYGYFDRFENQAMLIEELMMKKNHDLDKYFFFYHKATEEQIQSDPNNPMPMILLQKGSLFNINVADNLLFTYEQLFEETMPSEFLNLGQFEVMNNDNFLLFFLETFDP